MLRSLPMPRIFSRFTIRLLGLLLLLAALAGACEKDDICVDGDTPLLVMTFNDFEASEVVAQNVPRLRVIGIGNGDPITTFGDRSNRDSVGLPLRLDAGRTGFILILDSQENEEGVDTGNPDTLYLDYQVTEAFVSRACGFVGNYEGLSFELQSDSSNWIDSVVIANPFVRSSDSAHVTIYH